MTRDNDEPERTLTLDVEIDATPREVWEALTTGEGLERWFPPEARVSPGAGGRVWLSWGEGCAGEAPIHRWEPTCRFGWTEEHAPGRHATVEWTIEGARGKTEVRLVQSGFGAGDSWDEYFEGTERGWRYFLFNLKHALERHPGRTRTMVSARPPRVGSPLDSWEALFGPDGLDVGPDRTPRPGTDWRLHLDEGTSLRAVVAGASHPWTLWAVLPELDDALVFVEMEASHCGIWLSTYGVSRDRAAGLQRSLDRRVEALTL